MCVCVYMKRSTATTRVSSWLARLHASLVQTGLFGRNLTTAATCHRPVQLSLLVFVLFVRRQDISCRARYSGYVFRFPTPLSPRKKDMQLHVSLPQRKNVPERV